MEPTICDLQILAQLRRNKLAVIAQIVRERDVPDWVLVRAIKQQLGSGSSLLKLYDYEEPEVDSEG